MDSLLYSVAGAWKQYETGSPRPIRSPRRTETHIDQTLQHSAASSSDVALLHSSQDKIVRVESTLSTYAGRLSSLEDTKMSKSEGDRFVQKAEFSEWARRTFLQQVLTPVEEYHQALELRIQQLEKLQRDIGRKKSSPSKSPKTESPYAPSGSPQRSDPSPRMQARLNINAHETSEEDEGRSTAKMDTWPVVSGVTGVRYV